MTLLTWTDAHRANFGKANLLFQHDLHKSELFSDEALIRLIDRYPTEKLEVFTMGYDPTHWGQWFVGRRNGLDGRALMEGVKAGRLWLNLRKVNHSDPDIAALCDAMFAEIKAESGVSTFKQDLGLLISSPNAHVFYHLDMPLVTLWQIRGVKRVYVYPPREPFVSDRHLEGVALRESDEQLPFSADLDADAEIHDFQPGQMLTWEQNAPHRIVNHDMVNVSLSIEFMTTKAIWRANVVYANGLLRRSFLGRWFGLNPSMHTSPKLLEPFKVVFARAVKAMGGFKGHKSPLKPRFTVDATVPGLIHFDDGVAAPQKPSIQKAA